MSDALSKDRPKCGAHVSIAGGLPRAIENAVKIDAQCIQIFSSSPGQWNEPKHKQELIKKFIEQKKLHQIDPVFIHAKYLINLVSDKSWLADQSVRSLVADLHFSNEIGATGVIVHLGSHQGRGYETAKKTLVNTVEEVLEKTPRETRLIVENSAGQKGKLSSTMEEIADLFGAVSRKRLALCLDTCHLFAAGYDVRDKGVVDSLIHELRASRLLERLVVIHINDVKDPLGSHRDRHENLGEGQIGFDGLKTFVTHPMFRHLPKIIETPGFDQKGPDERNVVILNELMG